MILSYILTDNVQNIFSKTQNFLLVHNSIKVYDMHTMICSNLFLDLVVIYM